MIVEYTGRHTEVTPQLKSQAQLGLDRIAELAHKPESAHVILTEEKYRKLAEVVVKASGEELIGNAEAKDMTAALHDALKKAERQAASHKDKWIKLTQHPAFASRQVDEPTPNA